MTNRRIRIKGSYVISILISALLLVLLVGIFTPWSAVYADSGSVNTMIPSDDKDTLYNQHGVSSYSFQTVPPDRWFWEVGAKALDGIQRIFDQILSMLFLINVQIARFFTFVTRQAFEFSFMNTLIEYISSIIASLTGVSRGNLGTGLWGGLFGVFLSITLIYVLWQIVRIRFLDGVSTILSFMLAFVICLGFFSQAGVILKFMNNTTTELNDVIHTSLSTVSNVGSSSTDSVSAISDQVWRELVIRPYTMLQFDNPNMYSTDPNIGGDIATVQGVLATVPFSEEREEALSKVHEKYPAVGRERPAEQLLIILCNLIFSGFILGIFCYWSLVTIFIRIKLLAHAAIMSITLLASLLPTREAGLSVIRGQFIKLIGLFLSTVMTMFFLNFSLVFGSKVFDIVYNTAGLGWFTAMLLEAVVVFVIFKYRDDISGVFSKAAGVIPQMPRAKSVVVDQFKRNVSRTLYQRSGQAVSSLFSRKEFEGIPNRFNPAALTSSNKNISDATQASLMLRYQNEKSAAEQVAAEKGGPVQHTPYVSRINENLQTGVRNPFLGMEKEWKDEHTRLKTVKENGGDVKNAVLSQGIRDGMNDQEVAATLYSNENSIRQAASYMVTRPRSAVNQVQRAEPLNRNRKLETAVDDFVLTKLMNRYKAESREAVALSAQTGEPVKHTEFVKRMDIRFKDAGMNSNQQINAKMSTRSGRIAAAPHFHSMKEYSEQKMNLLSANEAFRRTLPEPVLNIPAPKINTLGPVHAKKIVDQAKKDLLPNHKIEQRSNLLSTLRVNHSQKIDMNKVTFRDQNLKSTIDNASAKLAIDAAPIVHETTKDIKENVKVRISNQTSIDATRKVSVDASPKISSELSEGLQQQKTHLEIMNVSKRPLKVAPIPGEAQKLTTAIKADAKKARNTRETSGK